ncbi:MAG: metallophosphoesterase family protein [Ardenticatenaceae bacterium]|nr:metallophosphoesterase family protein [Ardenticatenaceae bacterium]
MRVLVISDIHANLAAFEAVLKDAAGKWDKIWFLGDLVGYGPNPNECVALLQEHDHLALSGNHDWAVLGKLNIDTFNDYAKHAVMWAQDVLTTESHAYLESLPPMLTPHEMFTIAHASPRQPIWEYILDRGTADANFEHFFTPYCLVGHTHVPIVFEKVEGERTYMLHPLYNEPWHLTGVHRCIINPGSVGQPRDSDPRASYALLDLERMIWEYCRVDYDVETTQQRMRDEGLSERLVARLSFGW